MVVTGLLVLETDGGNGLVVLETDGANGLLGATKHMVVVTGLWC